MKCRNCKADNKTKSICDAGIACYVLRCGEYGCALNGKTVDKLLRMKNTVTRADRIKAMSDDELAQWLADTDACPECEYAGRKVWVMICAHEYVAPPMTHGDKLRAMTDEELAAYVGHASLCVTIQGEDGGAWCSQYGSCNECIRDWLREKVEADAKLD